ncbi:FAD/NAD(P)-binding domain-containing protein [Mycena sanguinolenta]|uniref:FAD/NAD(P)-binding domain-containing protein n=1 Tax=Mycena sanguinolenta TaxID=230812 RepID=A0A8H6WYU2_9AGAR|nr:FAD/NAD(P)-binding domain-containing protein [Mycena sanguinolenta]
MGATSVPSRAKVLVVGGGPGGSYTAAVLAREGIDVVVLESAKFPRYHIGESMLPSLRLFLRFIDCEEKVEKHGFTIKPGAAILYNQWKQEGYTKFAPGNHSWNVERAELDEILMRHAQECGAKVYEEHRVTELNFAEGSDHRPVSASYTTVSGESGSIDFDYLVDASGRAGIMSTKYLKNRHMNETLKNIACWAYWTGAGMYSPGTDRENAPWFEALTDESGWGWFIPLQNGVVSVGIVMDGKVSAAKKAAGTAAAGEGKTHTLYDHYMEQFQYVPRLWKLLEGAKLRVDPTGEAPTVKSATDFSYTAATYAGDHYRLVGDASAFIDPFFSSGVHLAIAGGLTAATTIAASIRGHCSEEEAIKFHDHKVAVAYTRFLLTVLGSYKQIRNQKLPVLSDVNENNFDRAFDFIRPVIQGTADAGQMLTEDELQKAMDFVTNVFVPTDSEMQERVGTRLGIDVLAPEAPLLTKDQIDELAKGDEDTENVLKQANAIKTVSDFYSGPERLLGEVVNGLTGRTKVGSLGLIRV